MACIYRADHACTFNTCTCSPALFDFEDLDPQNALSNLEHAFTLLETKFNVPRLLDADGYKLRALILIVFLNLHWPGILMCIFINMNDFFHADVFDCPDERSIMTYLASIYAQLKDVDFPDKDKILHGGDHGTPRAQCMHA